MIFCFTDGGDYSKSLRVHYFPKQIACKWFGRSACQAVFSVRMVYQIIAFGRSAVNKRQRNSLGVVNNPERVLDRPDISIHTSSAFPPSTKKKEEEGNIK